jgi:hypothetical protein
MSGYWVCKGALEAPFSSLAVRRFRWAAATIAAFYFLRLANESPFLSSAVGLLDHQAVPSFAWQPLFAQHSPDWLIQRLLLLGAGLALTAALSRWAALGAYGIAICTYRWNLPIVSIDDGMAHLLLFWLILLPDGRGRAMAVRGVIPRLIQANLSLIYLVAGLTKWSSPMWREGAALYAVLMLPGSRVPEAVLDSCWLLLCVLTWIALLAEPALAALPWVGPKARRVLAILGVLFHLGIALTFDVPVANLACLAIYILVLAPTPGPEPGPFPWSVTERFGLCVLVLLTAAMLGSALQPSWRDPETTLRPGKPNYPASGSSAVDEGGGPLQKSFYSCLWMLGLAQQYRLLDWIDQRNFNITVQTLDPELGVWSKPGPLPANLRLGLAMSYLTPVCWQRLPIDPGHARRTGGPIGRRCSDQWAHLLGQGARVRVNVRRVHPSTAGRHPLVFVLDLPEKDL